LSIGSWITSEVGERLIERGKLPDSVSLIVRGKVRITKEGRMLGDLIPGDIVGSALILNGIPSNVDAVTVEPLRAMRWQIGTLQKYLSANPETRAVMQRHLARDLAGKVGRLVEKEGLGA
jgi:CRP-like cAMP-binding protein